MKKRLLITSIVMMLVVAVALSTATYAWFTSNNSVTASTISMTAATSDAAALGIGWTDGNPSTELVASNSGTFYPMAPASLTVGTTLYDVDFNSATIRTVNNVIKFKDVTACDGVGTNYDKPVTFNNGASDTAYRDTFYVKNLSTANTIDHVTITATIENAYESITPGEKAAAGYTYYNSSKVLISPAPSVGDDLETGTLKVKNAIGGKDASDLVRIAVFQKSSDSYKLVCVMAKTASVNTVYGTPVADKNATAVAADAVDTDNPMANYTGTLAASTGYDLGSLAVTAQHDLAIVVWLDGALLDDDHQAYKADVSFTFTATRD